MKGVLHFDGACLPFNPGGVATFGWVLEWEGKKERGGGVESESGTNNVAEYSGLIHGLERAIEVGIGEITVKGDSQLVIYQLQGRYTVNSERIRPYYLRAEELLRRFKRVRLVWIPREENSEADRLSARAYVRYELLKEYEKKDTIREWEKLGDGLYRVNDYEVRLSSPRRYSCTCPAFKRKNSARLLRRSGIVVPCKHIAFVYFEVLKSLRDS